MSYQPYFIIFSGCDKTGKSTLVRELNKRTNYRHTIVDRGFIDTAVYSKKFERHYDPVAYFLQLESISKVTNTLLVLCEADAKVIYRRCKQHDEKDINMSSETVALNEIIRDTALFRSAYSTCDCNKIIIDTSKDSIEACINQIVGAMR